MERPVRGAYRVAMWPRKNPHEHRSPRDLIGHDPLTPENVHERIAAMLDLVEAMDDPWSAGASMGILAGLRDAGMLSSEDFVLYEAEHVVRIGKGCRWLDELKAAIDKRRSA